MSNWKPVSSFVSFTTKGITPKYVGSSSIIVLNQKCIRNNRIDYSFAQYTDESQRIAENKFVKKGDILVNSTGVGTAGRCAFVTRLPSHYRLIVDSHILILRCSSYHEAQCLNYVLYSFEEKLMSFMTGSSGQSELDKAVMLNLKTKMPTDSKVQEKIATVLSILDTKIELNHRINAELESMAKMLYDYWFVQFDFPNENGKPYKSTGGKMIWNEKLKREIPAKWEAISLSGITCISTESVNPMLSPETEFKHYSIPTFDKTGTYKIELGKEIKSNKYIVKDSDVLVSKLNPWFNRVVYSTKDTDVICSSEFVVWRTKNTSIKNYLYMIAKDIPFIEYCTRSASGTSHSHRRVNPQVMMKYQIAYNNKIANEYGSILGSTIEMLTKNKLESQTLIELRDWLLPKLMNGQVKVT